MANELPTANEPTDPRILRSRRMLMDSLEKLLKNKRFENISVQEIADEATLNRNTFYLHYPDKSTLLQAMAESRFRALIDQRRISFTDCDNALRAIALGVCDYLTQMTPCSLGGALIPLEGAVIPVVEGMFMEGVSRHHPHSGIDPAVISTTAAWAVFGAARRWHQTANRIDAEKMARKIASMVAPIFLNNFD